MADTSYADMDRLTPKQKAKNYERETHRELVSYAIRRISTPGIANLFR